MTGGWNPTLHPPRLVVIIFITQEKIAFFCPPALSDPETLDPAQPFLFQAKELLKKKCFSLPWKDMKLILICQVGIFLIW